MISASRTFGVKKVKSNLDLVNRTDIVILAVKPQDIHPVAREVRDHLRSNQAIISILAGTPIGKLRRFFGARVLIVRAMPNLGAQVGEAITAVTSSSSSALRLAETIFSGCGQVIRIPEKFFDLVTAVSGSGPAYFFLLMELLSKVAVAGGIPEKSARLLAVQTALGAGKLAQISADSPELLRKKVTSKKGTTEAALKFLVQHQFPKLFAAAVRRAVRRAGELSKF